MTEYRDRIPSVVGVISSYKEMDEKPSLSNTGKFLNQITNWFRFFGDCIEQGHKDFESIVDKYVEIQESPMTEDKVTVTVEVDTSKDGKKTEKTEKTEESTNNSGRQILTEEMPLG